MNDRPPAAPVVASSSVVPPTVVAAGAALVLLYALRLVLAALDERLWRAWFLREHGLLEPLEAIVWASALAMLLATVVRAASRRECGRTLCWLAFLTLLTLFALGEEVSWGQYVVGIEPGPWMLEHNVQKDITLHNLAFSRWLGLAPGEARTVAIDRAIDSIPYLFCVVLWIGLPLLRGFRAFAFLRPLPFPSRAVPAFLAANLVAYVAIDVLVVDVAELFELAIALTFLLAALDLVETAARLRPVEPRRT